MSNNHNFLIDELIKLLRGGSAHIGLTDALAQLPADARGQTPEGLPYSIWQLVEHIRIAQLDMLQFSINQNHQSPNWPDDYWPKETTPHDDAAWESSLKQIETDRETFIKMIKEKDIYAKLPHGEGQSLLREALQIADHTAYHISEIVVIRRLQGNWNR